MEVPHRRVSLRGGEHCIKFNIPYIVIYLVLNNNMRISWSGQSYLHESILDISSISGIPRSYAKFAAAESFLNMKEPSISGIPRSYAKFAAAESFLSENYLEPNISEITRNYAIFAAAEKFLRGKIFGDAHVFPSRGPRRKAWNLRHPRELIGISPQMW